MNVGLVENIAMWVGKMLRMFGLGEGESTELGWGQDSEGGGVVNVSPQFNLDIEDPAAHASPCRKRKF